MLKNTQELIGRQKGNKLRKTQARAWLLRQNKNRHWVKNSQDAGRLWRSRSSTNMKPQTI